jgi:epoxyqueuosine reductase
MDPRKCIAFLSYFKGDEIPWDVRAKMGTWVYGCDLCQEACPRNKQWLEKTKTMNPTLMERADRLQLTALLTMSQEQYTQEVWPLFHYIRKENRRLWQRNAAVALGNQGDPDMVPFLITAFQDSEPIVRGHAAWALGRLGGRKARAALERGRLAEEDKNIREEIERALGS